MYVARALNCLYCGQGKPIAKLTTFHSAGEVYWLNDQIFANAVGLFFSQAGLKVLASNLRMGTESRNIAAIT